MDLVHKVGIEIMPDIKYEQDWTTLRYLTVALKKPVKLLIFRRKKNIGPHETRE